MQLPPFETRTTGATTHFSPTPQFFFRWRAGCNASPGSECQVLSEKPTAGTHFLGGWAGVILLTASGGAQSQSMGWFPFHPLNGQKPQHINLPKAWFLFPWCPFSTTKCMPSRSNISMPGVAVPVATPPPPFRVFAGCLKGNKKTKSMRNHSSTVLTNSSELTCWASDRFCQAWFLGKRPTSKRSQLPLFCVGGKHSVFRKGGLLKNAPN